MGMARILEAALLRCLNVWLLSFQNLRGFVVSSETGDCRYSFISLSKGEIDRKVSTSSWSELEKYVNSFILLLSGCGLPSSDFTFASLSKFKD